MKKIFFVLIFGLSLGAKAQYGTLLRTLERLEKRRGLVQSPIDIQWDGRKFIHIQVSPEGIVEKKILSFDKDKVTLMEVYDDEKNGKITTNLFHGDFVFTRKNILNVRMTYMEKKQMNIPQSLTFLLNQQDDVYYLIESVSKQKWIDQEAITRKNKSKNKK
ncbi:hypothetical protein [Bergeyella zoohelcum]|uniref:DUF4251 domain-containing protein n=1 Tax=Bergeyella zoohelcum ATCC 43767 TaxID=883096 RepID=K1LJI1_9FLAO|nr:hypothetical protein [Bergeyella zoohelcum]EKB56910.1 hypothetical protein HMPREF9699_01193 [Bergeyella zoohelcum ATCC 43767]SUV48626.1 Uncharacterised protein [Bergeyella zoohelcum]